MEPTNNKTSEKIWKKEEEENCWDQKLYDPTTNSSMIYICNVYSAKEPVDSWIDFWLLKYKIIFICIHT